MIQGDDVREGLTAVISVKMAIQVFFLKPSQNWFLLKLKVIELGIYTHMMHYLEEHPKIADTILKKIEEASRAREAARKARDISRKSDQLSLGKLSSKLLNVKIRSKN